MIPDEAIARVKTAFQDVPRPERFIRGTCGCGECLEHDALLAAHTPDTITYAELGTPAWDPLSAASDQAFAYYLPAMIRLSFEAGYLEQLLTHLNMPGRVDVLTPPQAQAVLEALWLLMETHEKELQFWFYLDWLGHAISRLEQVLAKGAG